jgi:hypothetical protein
VFGQVFRQVFGQVFAQVFAQVFGQPVLGHVALFVLHVSAGSSRVVGE